jgi:hypothetical protein
VYFDTPGEYKLRLKGDDTVLSSTDDVDIFVFPATGANPDMPIIVDAGPSQSVLVGSGPITLNGTAKARAVPDCGTPTVSWTQVSPASPLLTIGSPNSPVTTVSSFSSPGHYVLRLTATFGSHSTYRDVTITVCNQEANPADIVLAFDASGSVDTVLGQARVAANTFLDLLDPSQYQVSLVPFAEKASIWENLTHEREQLRRSINALHTLAGVDTHISPALGLAQAELQSERRNSAAEPVLIIFSDGAWYEVEHGISLPQLVDPLKLAGIRIICVGFGSVNLDALNQAASSDEDVFIAGDATELPQLYATIASSFCSANNRRPVVSIPGPRTADLTRPVQLTAALYDEDPSTVTLHWENLTPEVGDVTFGGGNNILLPVATFSQVGTYTLKLTATDSGGLEGAGASPGQLYCYSQHGNGSRTLYSA